MGESIETQPTARENILETLKNGNPEWIPLIGHVDSYNRPSDDGLPESIGGAAAEHGWWSGHAGIEYARNLGITVAAWTAPPIRVEQTVCETETIEDGRDTTTIIHTPSGDLREIVRKADSGAAGYRVEHFLKTADDLPRFAQVFEGQRIGLEPDKSLKVENRARDVGDEGILISPMPGTPLGMLIRIYAGPETTAYLHADAQEALTSLFQTMEQNYVRQFQLASKTPIDAFLGMDDTSSNTESPAMFREYCLSYTDRVARTVQANGGMYWHHSCGLIHDLLPIYRETAMDAVHAFTEPPTGDVELDRGRALLGSETGIIAGLREMENPLVDRKATAGVIKSLFERASAGKRFCLCLSAYQHLSMEDIHWFREECRRYQVAALHEGAPA